MSGIFDPRAEAERLVVVVENTAPGGSVFRVAVVGAPVSMSYSRSVAEGERAKAASRIKVALAAAFSAGASSRDAEVEALRGADWGDKPLPEEAAISAAHPTRSGRHDEYAEAMRLVGAKRSKGALVGLVTWLLVRNEALRAALAEACDGWERECPRTSDEIVIARLRAVLGSKP